MSQQVSGFKPKASFYLFSLSTCGHCKHFKGETTDKDGVVHVSSKGSWEVLRKDKELYDMGVQFVLYQVGNVKNPKTGQIERFELEDRWKYIKGFPHLAMEAHGGHGEIFNFDRPVKTWNSEDAVPVVKKWIQDTLKHPKFEAKAGSQPSPQVPSPSSPPEVSAPAVPIPPPQRRVPTVQIPGSIPPSQAPMIEQRSTRQAVINNQQSGRNPSVFGMGTQQVQVPGSNNNVVPDRAPVPKAKTQFLPSNYYDN